MLTKHFGSRIADLVEAVTNPIYVPEVSQHDQYRPHVVDSFENQPWARVLKVSDFTDNGVGLHYTSGPKAAKLARKYGPMVPILADFVTRPDTPLTHQVKARILRQLDTATARFAAISRQEGR